MQEGRDKRGRFAKGNKLGHRFKAGGEQADIAKKGAEASKEKRAMDKMIADTVRRVLFESSPSQKDPDRTRLDDFIEKAVVNTFNKRDKDGNGMDLKDLRLLQEILGEDPKERDEVGGMKDEVGGRNEEGANVATDEHIAAIRKYLEDEKMLTGVDEMTLELLRYDLQLLDFINGQLNRSKVKLDRYGKPVPSDYFKERDKVIKRIMEYEKKLGLSPYDRKKLTSSDADDVSPLDRIFGDSELKPEEL